MHNQHVNNCQITVLRIVIIWEYYMVLKILWWPSPKIFLSQFFSLIHDYTVKSTQLSVGRHLSHTHIHAWKGHVSMQLQLDTVIFEFGPFHMFNINIIFKHKFRIWLREIWQNSWSLVIFGNLPKISPNGSYAHRLQY